MTAWLGDEGMEELRGKEKAFMGMGNGVVIAAGRQYEEAKW